MARSDQDVLFSDLAPPTAPPTPIEGTFAHIVGNLTVNTAGGSLTVTGPLTAGASVNAPQNVSLANATITGALSASAGNVSVAAVTASSITAGGTISASGAATVSGNVTAGSLVSFGSAASLAQNVTGNGITFGGATILNGAVNQTLNAGPGTLALLASASMNKSGLGDLTLLAREMDFGSVPNSINGVGQLDIRTTDASGKIGLGGLAGGEALDRLDLTALEVAALGSFTTIKIGDAATREIRIGSGAAFDAPLALEVNAGSAATPAIIEDITGGLTVSRLSLTAVGQVLLGNSGNGPVPDPATVQPNNQIAQLGDVTVNGDFYLYDGGAPNPYSPGEEGTSATSANSPFFLDPAAGNLRGLQIVGDFTQQSSAAGTRNVIRTSGDLNIMPGSRLVTGGNSLTVLSAETPTGSARANFHNAGGTPGADTLVGGVEVGSGSSLLVYSADANFNTFQRGAAFDFNIASRNGVLPPESSGGTFRFGRITNPGNASELYPGDPGRLITPNIFVLNAGLPPGRVQFPLQSTIVPPVESTKFVFFDFAPEPFAGITLDTQSFRTGISRPGTEIRTHSSLLYDFEEWKKKGRAVEAPSAAPGANLN